MVTLLIVIASIYLFGKLLKWLLPIYIMHKAKKFNEQRFGSQFSQQQQQRNKKATQKEGNVTVEVNTPQANQKIDKKLGDYVDYVEEDHK